MQVIRVGPKAGAHFVERMMRRAEVGDRFELVADAYGVRAADAAAKGIRAAGVGVSVIEAGGTLVARMKNANLGGEGWRSSARGAPWRAIVVVESKG